MNKISLSILASVACFSAAVAADLPSRAVPPMAPAVSVAQMSFSGVYIGLSGGYGQYNWQDKSVGNTSPKVHGNGGLIGGTIGYNYQMPSNLVVGVEGDLSWTGFDKKRTVVEVFPGGTSTSNDSSKADFLGTARLRLGYAIGSFMPYVTGGLAFSNSKHFGNWNFVNNAGVITNSDSYSASKSRTGWVLGAGVEALVTQNITVKAEYLYADFGTATYSKLCAGCKIKDDAHIGRIGVNYKF